MIFRISLGQVSFLFSTKIDFFQVWYGMVWYGMVWYGMVWYGMVLYGMVWYGMVWYGMVGYGMVWYGQGWLGHPHPPPITQLSNYYQTWGAFLQLIYPTVTDTVTDHTVPYRTTLLQAILYHTIL